MRAGQVVRMRVNPRDCMSAIDILQAAGIDAKGLSFSAAVSLAFSSMAEGLRRSGTIPNREGYDYLEIMAPFLHTSQKMKMHASNHFHQMGSEFQVAPVLPTQEASHTPSPITDTRTTEQRMAGRILQELCEKLELSQKNSDVTWQQSDQEEYDRLFKIVYPEG